MRIAGFGLVVVAAALATGCQQPCERFATRAMVERIGGEVQDQYLITGRVDRLDAQGNVLETITQPRVLCLADQAAHVALEQQGADGSLVSGVTIDVLVPSDAVPRVVKMTTTVWRDNQIVSKEDTDIPIPEPEPQ